MQERKQEYKKGLKEGFEQGIIQGKIMCAKEMLTIGIDLKLIIEITKLTKEQIITDYNKV